MNRTLQAATAVLRHALIGVDAEARPGFVNAAAAALLEAREGLVQQDGRLAALNAAATALLRQTIRKVAEGRLASTPLSLPRADGGSLPVLVSGVAGAEAPTIGALVHALDPRFSGRGPPATLLCTWLGTTPAEAEVALRAARGEGLPAIAEALGIGHSTARSHLQRVFQKSGTRRQAELAWLIAHLPG